ncbi:unnamed protein product [Peronospora belbahrii]|uniref:Uncharacterized protein n=1 Tax=Peronospora belbahrii TaxID=622444 RepID=A0ABN8DAV2_9STRA|nr:unnamed protein product [Peronospora belbahrii]
MSLLSTLSLTLLASIPRDVSENEVNWDDVSVALLELHSRKQEDLKEIMTMLNVPITRSRTFTVEEHDDVFAMLNQLKSLDSSLTVAEQHFQQLKSIIHPSLYKLQTLQSRTKYLETLVQVEKLSQQVKDEAGEATLDVLKTFRDFTTFAAAVPVEFSIVRKEANQRVQELLVHLHHIGVNKLQGALEKVGWPKPFITQQELIDKEVELHDVSKAFEYLLVLQLSHLSESALATTNLWAMDCVIKPLLLRFHYHFERAESATNRLTKPEWYLSYVLEQTSVHTRFLAHALTPELHRHRDKIHCWDAQILLLRGLVRCASRKLTHDLPTLLAHPPLLCHTLDEILLFEQTIDEDIGYDSWTSTDRRAYPRCIDMFTSSSDVLFAWTNADVKYAYRVLSSIFEVEVSSGESEFGVFCEKQDPMWQLEVNGYGHMEGAASEFDTELIPPVALHFIALLDFLSYRFTHMETEEHRCLYVMQVHTPLLRRFRQLCEARGRLLISVLTKKATDARTVVVWGELFVVRPLELKCYQMHMAYSKQLFTRASAVVLATEEATAVRQALAGPGAMIGPTAALSAAYSAGSKTMKNLFSRAKADDNVLEQSAQALSVDTSPSATGAIANDNRPMCDPEEQQDDPEAALFSQTIFERQILELRTLATKLLECATDTLVRAVERDVEAYHLSAFWTDTRDDDANDTHLFLLPMCSSALWKPLASALDRALFDAFSKPSSTEVTHLSSMGKCQFVEDVKSLTAIFAAGSSKALPRSYFQLTREVCHLLEMPAPRLREVCKALDDESVALTGDSVGALEQVTTILEACDIFLLTPAQVVSICTTRLDYCQ